ncbi:MAG TPA: DUF3429 domain-containing protein [Burkholderiaceae bacterium]|nr:DUF3429 domain-containing protein [Burkholderiaceae bacterium]
MTTQLAPAHKQPPPPVPALISALGHAGLVPFAGLCLLMWVVNDQALPYVALALVAYAALIASFLGGIHWGVVWLRHAGVSELDELPARTARQHLVWGVAPTILAWPGVLMPAYAALPWLGLLLVACYLVDRKLFTAAGLDPWLTLRFRLSAVAALSCFLAAGAL